MTGVPSLVPNSRHARSLLSASSNTRRSPTAPDCPVRRDLASAERRIGARGRVSQIAGFVTLWSGCAATERLARCKQIPAGLAAIEAEARVHRQGQDRVRLQ